MTASTGAMRAASHTNTCGRAGNAGRWRRLAAGVAMALSATGIGAVAGTGTAGAAVSCTTTVDPSGLQAAITAATAGDTICVNAGSFTPASSTPTIRITKSLTLLGAQADVTPIDGGRTGGETRLTAYQNNAIMSVEANNVTINGFEFDDYSYGISLPGGHGGRSNLTITNNWMHAEQTNGQYAGMNGHFRSIALNVNTGGSVTTDPITGVTITNNLIYANTPWYGSQGAIIGHSGGSVTTDVTITNNTMTNLPRPAGSNRVIAHGGGPGSYLINNFTMTGNTVPAGTWNFGNINNGTITNNTFGDTATTNLAAGYIGMINSTIAGNTFNGGAYLALWGTQYGFTRPSANVAITNNNFNAANAIYLNEPSVDVATTTFTNNRFTTPTGPTDCANSTGALFYGPATGTLNATRNTWNSDGTNPGDVFCGFTTINTTPWIHTSTPDPTKTGQPGYWPTAITEGFTVGTPVDTNTGTDIAQTFFNNGTEAGSITFDTIGTTGQTTVTPKTSSDGDYVTPVGFTLGTTATYYEITTTAAYTGDITLCLSYDPDDYPLGTNPQILHYTSSAWADVTTSVDTTNHIVCGLATSLSPFALGTGEITINAATDTKPYDATTDSAGVPTLDPTTPLIDGNTLADCTQTFDDANVGTSKTLTPSGCTVSNAAGTDVTASYVITYNTDTTGSITQAPLTGTNATVTVADRDYDGTDEGTITACTLSGTTGDVACDYSAAEATFNDRNAGTTKAVTISGLKLSGTNAANYSLTGDAATTATISKAALTIDAVTDSKPFDGTTTSSKTPTVTGVQTGDTVTGLSQSFDSSAIGTRTLSVNPGYTVNDGNSGANYTVSTNTATGSIGTVATTMAYTGPIVDADGNGSTTFTAQLGSGYSSCKTGQTVTFLVDSGSGWVSLGTAVTNSNGIATLTKTLAIGTYAVKVDYAGSSSCSASADDSAILTVADPSGKTHGGGWYYAPSTTTKVHFGFNAKVTVKNGRTTFTGDLKWTHDKTSRLKSRTITGITNVTCPTGYVKCATFTGTGDFSTWIVDATKRDGGYWGPNTTVTYTITIYDGGVTKVCSGKTCTNVEKPDAFGIDIAGRTLTGETPPANINKGNLKVN